VYTRRWIRGDDLTKGTAPDSLVHPGEFGVVEEIERLQPQFGIQVLKELRYFLPDSDSGWFRRGYGTNCDQRHRSLATAYSTRSHAKHHFTKSF
jgi:hypothetical protein